MIVSMIAAVDENLTLGRDYDMLWHLPRDLKFFKKTTMGHYVIQGRKTFEAFGKPLPGRKNVIITRNPDYKAEGCTVISSLREALKLAEKNGEEEAFIIGGGQIYRLGLPFAHKVYLTHIHHGFKGGNVTFPKLDEKDWLAREKNFFPVDDKNAWDITFVTYERKSRPVKF